jgi:propionyl-CoA synthetase
MLFWGYLYIMGRTDDEKIADGDQWTMPATIDDPAILGEIGSALKGHGLGG